MKKSVLFLAAILFFGCKGDPKPNSVEPTENKNIVTKLSENFNPELVSLSAEEANSLAKNALKCLQTEFPYRLNILLKSEENLKLPTEFHAAFLGCQSWDSAVHALWMLANLAKQFPEMENSQAAMSLLEKRLTPENIEKEITYFKNNTNEMSENINGWAAILKLSAEIHNWRVPVAQEMDKNLMPLANLMKEKIKKSLAKLAFPIRSGDEENTAFILNMAFDYAQTTEDMEFMDFIKKTASDFYLEDDKSPIQWEPSGKDILSPGLAEVELMSKVLSEAAFDLWIKDYMPQLKDSGYALQEVKFSTEKPQPWFTRLNYNRARVFYSLANRLPEYEYLRKIGDAHIGDSFSKIAADKTNPYLWSTALDALNQRKVE
ncbi:MAG TPA: DUF2891 family protein [Flavobacteriaceae bacterium]|nr:DUF2891 family protein [Flavobacteriaceae bacterium]